MSESRIKYLFFWGHRASKDGSITASCLSQWWPCQFVVDDILYKSTEHWMMAEKAKLFKDDEHWKQIIDCESPAKAKKLGRKVRGFDNEKWTAHRYEIVKSGNFYKFSQNENLKIFLLNTQNRVLVEASPVDNIWGIGLAKTDSRASNPNKWKGLNLLGFALMEVRERIEQSMMNH
ncbi:MAG TPA: NADAR family protein [Phaeodactylibacter sp.]|nr:NADAR family protein [Phaeodactylibacter sp.]